jgi:hypothetical protein
MGQGQSFCWNCGRFVTTLVDHDVHCKHYPQQQPNPAAQLPSAPPLAKQRFVRSCLTVWVALLCSLGTIALIVAIAFAAQLGSIIRPADRQTAQSIAVACAAVGAVLIVPGIVLAIVWCSMKCCCKKRWVCACCGRD